MSRREKSITAAFLKREYTTTEKHAMEFIKII